MIRRLAWTALIVCLVAAHAYAQERRLIIRNFPFSPTDTLLVADSVTIMDSSPAFDATQPIVYYAKQDQAGFVIVGFNYETRERKIIHRGSGKPSAIRVHPDGKSVSCLVRADSRSSLLQIPIGGGNVKTTDLPTLTSNFMWLDDNNAFIIREGKPNTLELMTLRPQRSTPVAQHVAGSLAKATGEGSFAFIHKLSVDSWSIKTIRPDGSIKILAEALPETEVFTLTPDGAPLSVSENKLFVFERKRNEWRELPNGNVAGKVRYMELNPARNKLALLIEQEL